MRLTKSDKQAFVRGVMADVPEVDYNKEATQVALEHVLKALPQKILDVYDDPKLREYLNNDWISTGPYLSTVYLQTGGQYEETNELKEALKVISEKAATQHRQRIELEGKLSNAIAGCNTLKQALTLFPEFEAYLPKEGEVIKTLPAVANLVVNLLDAGWQQRKTSEAVA